jgi:hypothetical protein
MPNHINYRTSNALAPKCSTYEQNAELTQAILCININHYFEGVDLSRHFCSSPKYIDDVAFIFLLIFSYASYTIPPYPCNRCIISSAIIN